MEILLKVNEGVRVWVCCRYFDPDCSDDQIRKAC